MFGVALVGLLILGLLFLKSLGDAPEKPKKQVQQITIVAPPPPPPPPPEMKQPEVKEEVVEETPDEPEPVDDVAEPDPGQDIAGGEGTDSGMDLGLRKGSVRGPGGGGGFGNFIKAEINKALLQDEELRSLAYEAIVTVWLEDDGSFSRFDIEMVTGEDATERELARFLDKMGGIGRAKPLEEKANRFRFHITSVI